MLKVDQISTVKYVDIPEVLPSFNDHFFHLVPGQQPLEERGFCIWSS